MTLKGRYIAVSSATALYVGVSAAAYSYFKPEPDVGTSGSSCGSAASFDGLADNYDQLVNREETFMGLKLLRWWLVRQAKVRAASRQRCFGRMPEDAWRDQCVIPHAARMTQGDALEISAGTGRNLKYYPLDSLSSLTVTDASAQMLWHAAQKQQQLSAGQTPVHFRVTNAACVRSAGPSADLPSFRSSSNNAENSTDGTGGDGGGSTPFSVDSAAGSSQTFSAPLSQQYDTVIDTFGLCSHKDPVEVLRVRKVVRVGSRTGQGKFCLTAC